MRESSYQHQPKLGRALFLLAGQVSTVIVLHRLGRYSWMRVEWDDLGRWVEEAPAEDVLLASARMLALVVAWWLLLSTVFYVGAAFAGWQRGLKTMRWAMVPGVGRLLDSMLAITLTSTPAMAAMAVTTPVTAMADADADASGHAIAAAQPGDDDMAFKMAIYPARSPLPPVDAAASPGGTYTVQAGDCLWEIAESQLGDPSRWREIWDLNRTRLEAGGFTDPDVIHIGWVLQLPGDQPAAPIPAPGASAPATPTSTAAPMPDGPAPVAALPIEVTVDQGDHLWSLAEDRLESEWGREASDAEIAPYWTEVVEANRDRLAPPGDPNVIYPGQQLVIPPPPADPLAPPPSPAPPPPPAEAPAPEGPVVVPTSTSGGSGGSGGAGASTAPTPADPTAVPQQAPGGTVAPATGPAADRQPADDDSEPIPVSLSLLSGGVGMAGMLMTLDRVRQNYLYRRGRRRQTADDAALAQAEERLREVADIDTARLLDAALRAAAAGAGRHDRAGAGGLPPLRWVEATPDDVVLNFLDPTPATTGFNAEGPDRWRTATRLDELDGLGGGVVAPAPCLASVGTTRAGVAVLVDLAAHGVVSVSGAGEQTRAWLRALALSVVTCPWSSSPRVLLVGFDDALTTLTSVDSCATLAEATAAAEEAEAASASASVVPEPLLVLSAEAPSAGEKRPLLGLAVRRGQRLAVVCPQGEGEPIGSVCSIDPAGYLRLAGVDTAVRAAQLNAGDTELVTRMLLSASGVTAAAT